MTSRYWEGDDMDLIITQSILDKLQDVEIATEVKIILAIESGSRGWGFAATNADYDCRFLYVHKQEHYLSIFERKEFIEYEVDEIYDVKGYDIKRALNYIVKSQATINEWLSSNVVYIKNEPIVQNLKTLASSFFNPIPISHHYLSLARKMLAEIMNAEDAKIKKYFYILRPIANLNYIHQYKKMPFMEYEKTLEATTPSIEIFSAIQELKNQKIKTLEHDKIPPNKLLIDYFISEIERFEAILNEVRHEKNTDIAQVDELFRAIIKDVWN
jgi:predicted nucleotidyltransferase